MATQHSRSAARLMMAPCRDPASGMDARPADDDPVLLVQEIPAAARGDSLGNGLDWVGFDNYVRFVSSSSFWPSVMTTLLIVGGVLVITVVLGILLAMLLDQPMWGQGIVRILVIAPFFVMPTVSALVWKNLFMDPVNGFLAHVWRFFGATPVEWLSQARCNRSS
jgi:sorbitol/mannitol transport system permease protein